MLLRQSTVKVGDLVEYYAPEGTPHNPRDVCWGHVMEILPSEGLNIVSDIHLIIDGLYPITYGRPIRLDGEGEWISTDNCECIVDRQDDGVRHQSGKFKAVLDEAKQSFIEKMFASSSEEESKEGGDVEPSGFGLVVKPCGLKQDGKREAISQLREDQKRRKADKDDPTYVPEVPRKKNSNNKSDTASNKKSAGDCVFDVSFVFLFFSIPFLINSSNI
jgi:hypothetical protein